MITDTSILTMHDSAFSWVRCEGKGSFMNSSILKEWCESEIKNGATCVVVDLEACKGMDSTFMGTIAGVAMRLMKVPDGHLQIATPGEKNKSSLADLGLDTILEIDPEDSVWQSQIKEVRSKLKPCESTSSQFDTGINVLEAHKKLCEADEGNIEKFASVLDCLEAEVDKKTL